PPFSYFPFLFTTTAPTSIYTLSLHDALPIFISIRAGRHSRTRQEAEAHGLSSAGHPLRAASLPSHTRLHDRRRPRARDRHRREQDRKSTRLNSSHVAISYAVFCLKKKITGNN